MYCGSTVVGFLLVRDPGLTRRFRKRIDCSRNVLRCVAFACHVVYRCALAERGPGKGGRFPQADRGDRREIDR